jgi:hypothetical protein
MAQFRGIGRGALEHVIPCCDRLMYGWSPSIDISTLRDVLSDISYGYSFVTDPANGLTDAYLELSRRACLSDAEGLLTDDDWDTRAVRQYLDLQREFQGSIMLLISLTNMRPTQALSTESRRESRAAKLNWVIPSKSDTVNAWGNARTASRAAALKPRREQLFLRFRAFDLTCLTL